jgi:hypothetical protein
MASGFQGNRRAEQLLGNRGRSGALDAERAGEEGDLYEAGAARGIESEFGEGFVYENQRGNLAIDRKVLRAFRKLTEDTVV